MTDKILFPVDSRVSRTETIRGETRTQVGIVIEVRDERRRIKWDERHLRTWINIKFLKPAQ